MADPQHLALLRQGVQEWNTWRQQHPEVRPDLSRANLSRAALSEVNLCGANLKQTYLRATDLRAADLREANLCLSMLNEANLCEASLLRANLRGAELSGADLSEATLGGTTFGAADLRAVKGLETVRHQGPSRIEIGTIIHSQGDIPVSFLRGIGLGESYIQHVRSLLPRLVASGACCLCYASTDTPFTRRILTDLQQQGILCRAFPEYQERGEQIRVRITTTFQLYDTLILIFSQATVKSTWVSYAVEEALKYELTGAIRTVYPLRLDDAVMGCGAHWVRELLARHHIADFRAWNDHDRYQVAFARLLHDLQASPPSKPAPEQLRSMARRWHPPLPDTPIHKSDASAMTSSVPGDMSPFQGEATYTS